MTTKTMEKFKNKYRVQSHRLYGWDYSHDGYYFITIVTQNRECNLGQIVETGGHAYLQLSAFGKIVETEWNKSFEIRNELFPDEFIIMPNHLHAIVILDNQESGENNNSVNSRNSPVESHGLVETHGRASLRMTTKTWKNSKINTASNPTGCTVGIIHATVIILLPLSPKIVNVIWAKSWRQADTRIYNYPHLEKSLKPNGTNHLKFEMNYFRMNL